MCYSIVLWPGRSGPSMRADGWSQGSKRPASLLEAGERDGVALRPTPGSSSQASFQPVLSVSPAARILYFDSRVSELFFFGGTLAVQGRASLLPTSALTLTQQLVVCRSRRSYLARPPRAI